jgi:hypothetical protein
MALEPMLAMSNAAAKRECHEVQTAVNDGKFGESAKDKYLIKREIKKETGGKTHRATSKRRRMSLSWARKRLGLKMRFVETDLVVHSRIGGNMPSTE